MDLDIGTYIIQSLRLTIPATTQTMASNTVQIPSVCLPRVYYKFDKNYVEQVFCELFGPDIHGNSCVERVDIIVRHDRNTNEPFHVVFVHFSENMAPTEYVVDFSKRILADEEVKIQYDYPWFWKVRQNRNQKLQTTSGPRIMSKRDEETLMETQRTILRERANKKQNNLQINTSVVQNLSDALNTPPSSPNAVSTSDTVSPKSNKSSSRKSWSELDEEEDEEE